MYLKIFTNQLLKVTLKLQSYKIFNNNSIFKVIIIFLHNFYMVINIIYISLSSRKKNFFIMNEIGYKKIIIN